MSAAIDIAWLALAPTTTAAQVDAIVDRAVAEGVAAIVVPPAFARRAVDCAAGRVEVHTVVGHPLGLNKPTLKAIEATSLAKDDVAALIVTPLAANVLGDLDAFRQELLEIARGARAARPAVRLVVRVDLAWGAIDVAAIAAMTIRGAFDGVAIEGDDVDVLCAAVRSIGDCDVTAIAREAGWAAALESAGAKRVALVK